MSKNSKNEQTAKIFTFHPTGEYYFTKGLKAYHRRDLYKAKRYLERALELEPLEPIIACQLAIVSTEMGEYQFSNILLEDIITNLDPYMSECHYFLANNFAHLGMFKEAYKHANDYLNKDKSGEFIEDVEELLDLITLEQMDSEESIFEQDTLINEQEEAKKHIESGDFVKAIEVLNRTIEEHPDFWFAYNNLALAHFYLGEKEKAFETLYNVLEKNPGNLHAMCNLLFFYHFDKNEQKVEELVTALEKIRPIHSEQQYKLAATYALIGHYDLSYMWLKKLQRIGYDGDDTFYYWISTCAYQLGHEQAAHKAWKKVIQLNPEKEGLEPWGEMVTNIKGFEQQISVIKKKLAGDYIEERLFGLFLYKHSSQKDIIKKHPVILQNDKFTTVEKHYLQMIETEVVHRDDIYFADAVAELIYKQYHPITISEAGLYFIWFSVWTEGKNQNIKFSNPVAWAGAVEYVWGKMRDEAIKQNDIVEKYNISASTVRKYVKMVQQLLD